jgi:uncharacterized protein DUF1707
VGSGPWDPTRPGTPGRNRFLASDADRDRVVEILTTAFVHGALTREELSARTGQALASRTYGDLALLTTGLTSGLDPRTPRTTPVARPRPAAPARAWKRVNKKVLAWTAVGLVLPFVLAVSFLSYYGGFLVMMGFTFVGAVLLSKPPNPRRPGRPG